MLNTRFDHLQQFSIRDEASWANDLEKVVVRQATQTHGSGKKIGAILSVHRVTLIGGAPALVRHEPRDGRFDDVHGRRTHVSETEDFLGLLLFFFFFFVIE